MIAIVKRRLGLILAVAGPLLVILGVLWMTVIYPSMSKLPASFHQVTNTAGTVTLLDSDTLQSVTYDVIGTREFTAVKCDGDTIYITEDISFVDADTGEHIPSLDSQILLALDRTTRANVAGHGDRDRNGYWSLPSHLTAGEDYPCWITGNPVALESRYVGEEDFEGVHVFVYEMATPEEGITIPAGLYTPEMRLYQRIESKVEPISGTVVHTESVTKRYAVIPVTNELFPNTGELTFTEMTVYEDQICFTDAQVEQFVSDARSYASMMPMAETTMPAIMMGLGVLLALGGAFLIVRQKKIEAYLRRSASDTVS